MAGSLNHIVNDDGTFTMDMIENMRDAREALEECHQFIAYLLEGWGGDLRINAAANTLGFPTPSAVPILQLELLGPSQKRFA